jgi:hypothetical protein
MTAQPWIEKRMGAIALTILAAGFLLRLYLASGTFLNPDEALHFFIANRSPWLTAYRESLTMAHPPLLIFLLYGWRNLGTSEIMLRLPSVLLGAAFCWVFFQWLTKLFGATIGLVGLLFATLLAPMALLSAEVRQYELLLFFAMSATYLLELAFEHDSGTRMVVSAACLYLAMLSHYSALLWVVTLGIYGLMRLARRSNSFGLVITWLAAQLGALALAIFLYITQVSKIKKTTMVAQAFDSWLYKSYFHAHQVNPIAFVFARTFAVFQFMFGQNVVGDVAAIMFVAGVVILWRGKVPRPASGASSRQLAVLLLLPFAVNCTAALCDAYPYGGTRHSIILAIFGLTGISVGIVRIAGGNAARSLGIVLGVVALCWGFRSVRHQYIYRVDQSSSQMEAALAFVHDRISPSEIILVDYESGLELGHYLCAQRQILYDGSIPGFLVFTCGGHRIVSTINDLWAFDAPMFFDQWKHLVTNARLTSGDRVWVVQAGWIANLAEDLKKRPEFQDLDVHSFGKNIRLFPMTVSEPGPESGTPASATAVSSPARERPDRRASRGRSPS